MFPLNITHFYNLESNCYYSPFKAGIHVYKVLTAVQNISKINLCLSRRATTGYLRTTNTLTFGPKIARDVWSPVESYRPAVVSWKAFVLGTYRPKRCSAFGSDWRAWTLPNVNAVKRADKRWRMGSRDLRSVGVLDKSWDCSPTCISFGIRPNHQFP